jgi:hypothetical protein
MSKEYQPITQTEFLDGLSKLEKMGELTRSKESILNEIISNTSRSYLTHGKNTQPINAKEAKLALLKERKKFAKADAEQLRNNMIKAGRALPKNTDAHHIVPSQENRPWAVDHAVAARAILTRWGISINNEANGVALPTTSKTKVKSIPNAYPHKKVHTLVYYLNIAAQLRGANNRTQCIETLREIGEDLEDGVYPIRKK